MSKITVTSPITTNVVPPRMTLKPAPKYGIGYTDEDIIRDCVRLYIGDVQNGPSERKIVKHSVVSRSTLMRHFKDSGLKAMKASNVPVERARAAIVEHLENKKKNVKTRTTEASRSCRYLTDHEELSIVHMCSLLAAIGKGVSRDELLVMVNEYISLDMDGRDRVDASEKVIRNLFLRYPDQLKVVSASSLDPKRAAQATEDTRDAVFCKLNGYIKMLFAMDKVPWETYAEVPKESIFNMDEVSNDTTKHRKRIIAGKSGLWSRVFQNTPEGDGKMSQHITVCLTTRADGECRC